MTYIGDGVNVRSMQAEVTDHLKAPVVSSQVEWSSAILDKHRLISQISFQSTQGDM